MKYAIRLKDQPIERGMQWLRDFFEQYDTSKLQSLTIDRGQKQYKGVYGCCHYSTKKQPNFRIACHVPGPFPCDIVTRKRPLYPDAKGRFPRAPRGCRRGVRCYDPVTKRKWIRVIGKTRVTNMDEAIVWIVAHEVFHFLRHTRQIAGRNTEIQADQFADEQLDQFRQARRAVESVEPVAKIGLIQRLLFATEP